MSSDLRPHLSKVLTICYALLVAFLIAVPTASAESTSTIREQLPSDADCQPTRSDGTPWVVILDTEHLSEDACMGYLDPLKAHESITEIDQLPSTDLSGQYSENAFVVTFIGEGVPDVVDVGVRYGGSNSNYIPITTCLAPDVTRFDNLPKNDSCSVTFNNEGYYEISFSLSERFNTLESLTITLLVHKVKETPQPGDLLADVYQLVIVLNRD